MKKKPPHYLKHRFLGKIWICPGKWSRTHFVFAATTSFCPLLSLRVLILLPRYFSARRRLQNDKFSTLKKDFRCLRGTFCAALSFRLRFASLVLFPPSTLCPFSSPFPSSLSHSLSLFLSLLTYLSSFLARSLHPSPSLSALSVALVCAALLPPLLPCKFTMPSLVISGCALRSRL